MADAYLRCPQYRAEYEYGEAFVSFRVTNYLQVQQQDEHCDGYQKMNMLQLQLNTANGSFDAKDSLQFVPWNGGKNDCIGTMCSSAFMSDHLAPYGIALPCNVLSKVKLQLWMRS